MKKYSTYLITLLLIVAAALLFYKKVYLPKSTFEVIHPTKAQLDVDVKGIGLVGAKEIYPITATYGGKILALKTDIGHWVKKGDLLVVMDGVDLHAQLELARANVNRAKYELQALQDTLKNQRSQKELIQITFKRYKSLHEKNYTSQAELDKATTDLQGIIANISATQSKIKSAQASIVVAQKSVKVLKNKIAHLQITAPCDGYVIEKSAQVAQNVAPTQAIFKIVDTSTLRVQVKVDEKLSSTIQPQQKAVITLRSGKKVAGYVNFIEPVSDAVTLERVIDIRFAKPLKPFYINEQAEVSILTHSYKNVLTIPSNVIIQRGGVLGIWSVKSNHTYFKAIDILAQNSTHTAVKNLSKETQIILPKANKKPLSDGTKINLVTK